MYYYGFMVSLFDGGTDKLEGEFDYKPEHENCGTFGYAKWYSTESERDELLAYTKKYITDYQIARL